ncbi:MAG: TIGR00730 family Rossman fold protein [Hyphomicrobiales bacterium]|nr:TIGR00730 family Rossman fold protein [Hyphomicrobiales bacterium]MBV9433090.1 TIGR00730 family Rossman fold protein [Hyphomicrobiales bacterium]MBV9741665.1 TIGR00730 family Rossman fold protein [Hyphomicrobiales bacterium]
MREIRSICVYCGSGQGTDAVFSVAARVLGQMMAKAGIRLVYGGGRIGLMGEVARSVLDTGGRVTGIIPEFLKAREVMLADAQELHVVADMHARKKLMFDKADAFIALPGGVGTLEELVEQLTWAQLGRHDKPILIANINGFWRPLLSLLAHMRESGFVRPGLEVKYLVADRIEDALDMILAAAPVEAPQDEEARDIIRRM